MASPSNSFLRLFLIIPAGSQIRRTWY